MLKANQFSVKFVGNLSTPEIKRKLKPFPQRPLDLFSRSKNIPLSEARTLWRDLQDEEKKPFIGQSAKQKDLSNHIKLLSKQHYSIEQAIIEVENALNTATDEYSKIRLSDVISSKRPRNQRKTLKKARAKAAFEKYKTEWKQKNSTDKDLAKEDEEKISECWKALKFEEKKVYYN